MRPTENSSSRSGKLETIHGNLPTGTVTFFFSDIEDSTRLWEAHPQGMRAALARHDEILQSAVASSGGTVIKSTGDGIHGVFHTAGDALRAALLNQRAMSTEPWPSIAPETLKIRIGIHSGEAQERDGDYFGPAVNRAARIMSIGHGGQVLLSDVTARLVEAALAGDLEEAVTFRDMGDVRLRGSNHPQHVYQLLAGGLPADFPPLRTEAVAAGNLPWQMTSFIGREREKVEVARLLLETRLLTLTGPGGTGKTRLSLEVAGGLQDNYAHGIWLVELAPLNDPGMIPTAVAGLWNLRGNPAMPLEQVLADYLRGKEMLLILDNCEHLVSAVARLAADLLAAAPRLTILASSREGLGVPGETTYHLPTLRVPEREIGDPRALLAYESVILFVERARSVQPGFALTADNAEAVGSIVRRLDGIPLAIELAAARLRLLPPQQLAERLDDRFRLLTGGARTALPRQQTLRALIDWSYDHLNTAEQALFRQLGVFAGGWTLEAAEAVVNLQGFESTSAAVTPNSINLAGLDVFDLLASLVNKSLVIMDDEEGQARFRFLETIRQYARDRLFESGEGPAVRERHLDFFAGLVLGGMSLDSDITHLTLFSAMGSPEMMAWVAQVRPEKDNVRLAIQWALQTDPELALAMTIKLAPFFVFEGVSLESRPWLEAALLAVEELDRTAAEFSPLREKLLLQGQLWKGNLELGEGHNIEAVETLKGVAEKARRLGLSEQLSVALGLQSLALAFLGRSEAYDIAAEGLAIMKESGERSLQGLPLGSMLMAKIQEGDMEAVVGLREEIKALIADSTFINALQIVTLARTASHSRDAEDAEALLKQAKDMFDRFGNVNFHTMIDSEIGHLRRFNGNYATAAAIYRRTIRQWQDLGHQAAVANQLETLAFIAIHQERYNHAATLLGAAEALRERLDVDMLPDERTAYNAEVAALHEAMDSGTLDEAWQAGRGLDVDSAVDFALAAGGGE